MFPLQPSPWPRDLYGAKFASAMALPIAEAMSANIAAERANGDDMVNLLLVDMCAACSVKPSCRPPWPFVGRAQLRLLGMALAVKVASSSVVVVLFQRFQYRKCVIVCQ